MKLIYLDNQKNIDRLAGDEFLQSWFWGETTISGKEEVERFGAEDRGELVAVATVIKKPLFGPFSYWYIPRGPQGDRQGVEFILQELKKKKPKAVFLRFEPEDYVHDKEVIKNLVKTVDWQPAKTLMLDLGGSEEELLGAMHQKTRYNIRLAEKKGVTVREGKNSEADFREFWRLMSLTGERDGFRLHSFSHYQRLLEANKNIKLFFASYQGKNIATGLFCFFSGRVTYLHGASDSEARNLMAPYLLQWELIKQAKKEGFRYYDFYGISEEKWPGVTRFKLGFGGFTKDYPGTHDFVFRPAVYHFYEFLRQARRRIGRGK